MQNFMRASDKTIFTPTVLGEMMGIDVDNEALVRQAGFVPVLYPYPAYDNLFEYMTPDGDPRYDLSSKCYVQSFKVNALDDAVIAENLSRLAKDRANAARVAADAAVAPYMAEFSGVEKQTWAKQQAEVTAYLIDNSAPTPTLDGLAQARGIERSVMLEKAIAKVTAFEPLSVAIVGRQQAYEDQIKAIAANESKTLKERITELRELQFDYSLDSVA